MSTAKVNRSGEDSVVAAERPAAVSMTAVPVAITVLPFSRGMRMPSQKMYHFGDFALVPALFELRRRGERVAIAPKTFDFLLYLVENRNRVATHGALRAALWSGVIVTDASLTYTVMSARRVLGDSGCTQTFIRNVRGRGYQFIAAVHEGTSDA